MLAIRVPPPRHGLAPLVSLFSSSALGKGWVACCWLLAVGFSDDEGVTNTHKVSWGFVRGTRLVAKSCQILLCRVIKADPVGRNLGRMKGCAGKSEVSTGAEVRREKEKTRCVMNMVGRQIPPLLFLFVWRFPGRV